MEYQNTFEKPVAKTSMQLKLPLIIWLIFIGSIMAFTEGRVLGYRLTGFGWFLPFCAAVLIILARMNRIKFPVLLWLPWVVVVTGYYFNSDFPALQRSVQLLCPIIIGMAVSTYSFREEHIKIFFQFIKVLFILMISIIIFRLGVPFTGVLPDVTGLSGQSGTAILFCVIYATSYSLGNKKDLRWWWLAATIPVIAVTRTAIAITGLTLPFTFGPMKLSKRIVLVIIIILLGFILFHTPRIQKKSFQSGEGEMSDILSKDFRDNARFYMWKHFDEQIKRNPWFGYGTGAGERFVRQITDGVTGYPHNDWRLTLYDYGIFGTSIYVFCIIIAIVHAYRKSIKALGKSRLLFIIGVSSFIPFIILMYTDNIMIYISFFGNLQFTILGMAYASQAGTESTKRKQIKVRW